LHDGIRLLAGEIEMRRRTKTPIAVLLLVFFSFPLAIRAQGANPQDPSLGDLAKKTREEKQSKDHVAARKTLDDDDRNLAGQPVRVRYPAGPQWALVVYLPAKTGFHPGGFSYGYAVPLEESRMYIVVSTGTQGNDLKRAEETSIRDVLYGATLPSSLVTVESWRDTQVGGQPAVVSRFKFFSRGILHKGINLLVLVNQQIMSVGCLYRQLDTEKAAPICDDVIGSADVDHPPASMPRSQSPGGDPDPGEDDP
jgi:hypothetical protein